jgi:hypothetical protein
MNLKTDSFEKILILISEVTCPTITANANSAVKLTSPSTCQIAVKTTCEFQDVVNVECNADYEKADGTTSSNLICQADKSYDMSPPTCQSKSIL